MNWVVIVIEEFNRRGKKKEELCVVPEYWLSEDKIKLYWPPTKSEEKNFSAKPTENWKTYTILKLKFTAKKKLF